MERPRGFTESMARLWEQFSRMPGIGRRSAERLTYYVLESPKEDALRLAQAVMDVKEKLGSCSVCFSVAESDPCEICADSRRDQSLICVVESARDLLAIEAVGSYRGVYHVLGGRLNPLDGVGPENLNVAALKRRLQKGGVKEVILATNPDIEGDATALYVAEELSDLGVKVTRLARGLPAGGSIQHASPSILADAIAGRSADWRTGEPQGDAS